MRLLYPTLAAVALAVAAVSASGPASGSSDTGAVVLRVTVPTIARIAFPEGRDFAFQVNRAATTWPPAAVPFVVTANVRVDVEVRPERSLRTPEGRELGAAVSVADATEIGFACTLHLSTGERIEACDGPEMRSLATDPRHGPITGRVDIRSEPGWTKSGRNAAAGLYAGKLMVSIAPSTQ